MRTVEEILTLADEFHSHKVSKLVHFTTPEGYKRVRKTDRWIELLFALSEDKIFRCSCCGCMHSYIGLHETSCDWDDLEEGIVCADCYDKRISED